MLALRGLDYDVDALESVVDYDEDGTALLAEEIEALEAAEDELPEEVKGMGHAILVHRMMEYERELSDFADDDDDEEDEGLFGAEADEDDLFDGGSGSFSIGAGGGADGDLMAAFDAKVGVVRGHLPVPPELSEAVALLQEEKLSDILLIDLAAAAAWRAESPEGDDSGLAASSIGSHMVLASGQSNTQIWQASHKLASLLREKNLRVLGTEISVEGQRDDEWLVVDGGACVFSFFLPEVRDKYDLEGLWGEGGRNSGWESDGEDDGEDPDDDLLFDTGRTPPGMR